MFATIVTKWELLTLIRTFIIQNPHCFFEVYFYKHLLITIRKRAFSKKNFK
ncbi:hypothetical protein SAMN05444338_10192 [Flavobacterium degerlachei]|jgi:hypothetical protein|uniref:Uncharacterized protein n=1 Tax=Flavobacterium degerlachei TaxID=229203 RepID=A0A1H2Q761_9FLAO|nr:hypothetical protein SAMN05444338_10192 [Flavobacterium degerlachei]